MKSTRVTCITILNRLVLRQCALFLRATSQAYILACPFDYEKREQKINCKYYLSFSWHFNIIFTYFCFIENLVLRKVKFYTIIFYKLCGKMRCNSAKVHF